MESLGPHEKMNFFSSGIGRRRFSKHAIVPAAAAAGK